jgi:translation initiation factor 2D
MFKKPFKIATESVIAVKDRKKMRQELQEQFDKDSIEKLFIYADTLTSQKLEKSKIVVFRDETDPLIIDSTSNKDYFPSVYCLQLFPDFVKIVFELKPDVDGSIKKGGKLTWAGVANLESLPEFQGDEVVAIRNNNGKVIAVGAIACSKKSLEEPGKMEEVAAYVLHMVEDQLYESGSKKEHSVVFRKPTADELKKQAEADSLVTTSTKKDEDEDNEDVLAFYKQINKNKTTGGVKTANLKKHVIKAPLKSKANNRDDFSDDENQKHKGGKKKKDEKEKTAVQPVKKNEEEGDEKEDGPISTKEADEQLMEAFLNCLIISLNEDDLPIENAALWKEHILPCRRPGTTLDIKNTSYKKLAKFFAHADKVGIITFKESNKKSATATVTHINRKNHQLSNWEPTISSPMSKDSEERFDKGGKEEKLVVTCEVVNMCKPDSILKKYLNLAPDAEFITHDEMERNLKDFLKKAGSLQKEVITINNTLKEDFNIQDDDSDDDADEKSDDDEVKETKNKTPKEDEDKKKKVARTPSLTIKLSKFMQLASKRLTYIYRITDLKTKKETIKQGKFDGVSIFAEKAHNKFLTRVTSLGVFGLELESVLAEWQSRFSSTGSIHEVLINKQHVKEISLNGLFLDEIKEYLTTVLKIPENMIVTVNKVDKKKKKNTRQM